MTWEQWVGSRYCTDPLFYVTDSGEVRHDSNDGEFVSHVTRGLSTKVRKTDKILPNVTYGCTNEYFLDDDF